MNALALVVLMKLTEHQTQLYEVRLEPLMCGLNDVAGSGVG